MPLLISLMDSGIFDGNFCIIITEVYTWSLGKLRQELSSALVVERDTANNLIDYIIRKHLNAPDASWCSLAIFGKSCLK